MRILIIDDEPQAREALANVLAMRSDVESFDTARDANEALDKLGKESYDILLLDLRMAEVSGFELLDRMQGGDQPMPAIVFLTGHQEHASAPMEKHALDYARKPFSVERLGRALDAVSRRSAGERTELLEVAPELQKLPGRRQPTRIAIKTNGRILLIDPDDVVAIQAEGNYVLLQRASGSYLLRVSISEMAEKLKAYGFVRIHRSVLVNSSFVLEIQPCSTGEYVLRVKGGKEYTVTRTYKKNLKSLADFWIGTETFLAE